MWIELSVYNFTYYGSTASEHLYVKFGKYMDSETLLVYNYVATSSKGQLV